MQTRALGPFTVSAVGFGGMPLSLAYGSVPGREQGIATLHAALDAGITLIDTADIYAPTWDTMGHNEALVGEALRTWGQDPSDIVVATKGGVTRGEGETWGRDGSPGYLRRQLEASLTALGRDVVDVYQWHRPDLRLAFTDVVEDLARLREEGLVRAVGLCNVNSEQIEVAAQILGPGGLASVQNELSPRFRSSRGELELCGRLGVSFLAYSPLGGEGRAGGVGVDFPVFAELGQEYAVSPHRVVLAWELALGEHVIPIPGATRPATITDSAQAADLVLTQEDLARVEAWWR